ncbi:MAG: hypothetical protein WKF96_23865 [Solirubrobacteraceae bacterium]
MRALREAVPRTWHYTTMDGPLKLSDENTLVLDLRSLGSDSPNARGFSSRYGKLARRECGSTVTQRSWLAVVYFPTSQAADLAVGTTVALGPSEAVALTPSASRCLPEQPKAGSSGTTTSPASRFAGAPPDEEQGPPSPAQLHDTPNL